MEYTYDWNAEFKKNVKDICDKKLCIEIGCFEGLTSNYIVDNILDDDGKLICIDPLTDKYLNDDLSEIDKENNNTVWKYFENQYDRFISNTHHNKSRIELYRNLSSEVFSELIEKYEGQVDLIYVDGDHRAHAVYIDAINSFKLCKIGGLIIFDDYSWEKSYDERSTSFGIDKFLKEFEGEYEMVTEDLKKDHQVVIKKII